MLSVRSSAPAPARWLSITCRAAAVHGRVVEINTSPAIRTFASRPNTTRTL
jgi:hypothetical protein